MDLKEYQQNALRTESIIDKLKFNKEFIVNVFNMAIVNAELLDAVKKEVYYNNSKKMNENFEKYMLDIDDLTYAAEFLSDRSQHDLDITLSPRVFHGIIGIVTEAGELLSVLVKNLSEGKPIDAINVQEELGDIAWYTAILNDELGLNWSEGLAKNIAKLRKRYPEKYTHQNAVNRNLEVERAVLEDKTDK